MRPATYILLLSTALTVSAISFSVNQRQSKDSKCFDNKRVEWRNMTKSDKHSFVSAVQCLMDAPPSGVANVSSRFDELAWAHNQLFATVHQTPLFLPWHRYFVYGYETMLRNECGYEAQFPWWYEVQDAGNFAGSGLFEPDYFGTLREIEPPEPDMPSGPGFCVTDGISANRTISVGFEKPQCLRRGEIKEYSSLATRERIDACQQRNMTEYQDHAECVNSGVHTSTHVSLGEVMAYVPASANDPVFFMHHGFVDWEWRKWQLLDDRRSNTTSGCLYDPNDEEAPCTPVTLNTVLTSNGVFPDMTIRDVVNPAQNPLCYEYDFY